MGLPYHGAARFQSYLRHLGQKVNPRQLKRGSAAAHYMLCLYICSLSACDLLPFVEPCLCLFGECYSNQYAPCPRKYIHFLRLSYNVHCLHLTCDLWDCICCKGRAIYTTVLQGTLNILALTIRRHSYPLSRLTYPCS